MKNFFVDADVFLGMHSKDDQKRVASKNFFVKHFETGLTMTFEQIGYCDHVIWNHDRKSQDAYYPFMDLLHSEMNMSRVPTSKEAVASLSDDSKSITESLLLAEVETREGVLYVIDPLRYADSPAVQTLAMNGTEELKFPKMIERSYQNSLVLRI